MVARGRHEPATFRCCLGHGIDLRELPASHGRCRTTGVEFDIPSGFASLVGASLVGLYPVTLKEPVSAERAFASKTLTREGEMHDRREKPGVRESVRVSAPQGLSGAL